MEIPRKIGQIAPRTVTSLVMLLTALFLIAHQAPADPAALTGRERVLIVSDKVPAGWVDRLYGGLLASGLATADGRDRIGVDKMDNGQLDPVRIDNVRDRLLTAQASMRTFDYAKVRTALDEAETLLLKTTAPLSHIDVYRDILLMRAGLDVSEGSLETARDELTLLARLDPQLDALHPGLYPPPLVEAYARVREREQAGNTAAVLAITPRTAPAQTQTQVDATLAQSGAMTLRLAPGPHVVSIARAGRVTFAQRIELVAGRTTVLSPHLPEPGAGALRKQDVATLVAPKTGAPKAANTAAALAARSGCTVVVHLRQTGMTLYKKGQAAQTLPLSGDALVDANAIRVALTPITPKGNDGVVETEAATPFGLYAVLGVAGVAALGFIVGVVVSGSVVAVQLNAPQEQPKQPRPVVGFCCGPPPSQGGT